MKLRFLPADILGRYDGILHDRLFAHMPNFVYAGEDVVIVPISHFSDYRFNSDLLALRGKKWVLVDTMEYYGAWPEFKTHLFGQSETLAFGGNTEWQVFSNFVKENPPILYFCRELFTDISQENVVPIEWPCPLEPWSIENKNSFDGRPFEVFFNWGFSSCYRPQLHGEIYKGWCRNGYEVIGNLDHIDAKINEPIKKWVSVHIPHTHRRHINEIALRQAQSKITVSLMGAGVTCFRSTESPVHSIPAIHSKDKVWSFPWRNLINSFHLTPGNEYEDLLAATKCDFLHNIYLEAQENIENYRTKPYIDRYIIPSILKFL